MKILTIVASVFIASLALTSITSPTFVCHSGFGALTKVQQDMKSIRAAIDMFELDRHAIPTQDDGLRILAAPNDSSENRGRRYLRDLANDRWDSPYIYSVISKSEFSIHSAGPNRVDEKGKGDDVIEGEKEYRCEDFDACKSLPDYVFMLSLPLALLSFLGLVGLSVRGIWRLVFESRHQ
jgi:type II secretion system protein G